MSRTNSRSVSSADRRHHRPARAINTRRDVTSVVGVAHRFQKHLRRRNELRKSNAIVRTVSKDFQTHINERCVKNYNILMDCIIFF